MRSRRRGDGLVALAAATGAIALAGCGGGGAKAPAVARLATTTSAAAPATGTLGSGAPPSQGQLQRAALKYAACMRAHGVRDFPDPTAGGGFEFQPGAGVDPSSPAVQAARATCRKLLPAGGPPGPGTTTHPSARTLAHFVRIAECMRRHGVPAFPDPRTSVPRNVGDAGVISDIEGVLFVFPSATIDLQSPAVARAAAACGFPLHNH